MSSVDSLKISDMVEKAEQSGEYVIGDIDLEFYRGSYIYGIIEGATGNFKVKNPNKELIVEGSGRIRKGLQESRLTVMNLNKKRVDTRSIDIDIFPSYFKAVGKSWNSDSTLSGMMKTFFSSMDSGYYMEMIKVTGKDKLFYFQFSCDKNNIFDSVDQQDIIEQKLKDSSKK